MSAGDFLTTIVAALEQAGVEYMITGSFASTFHGAPRTTQDLDIVVAIDGSNLERLLDELPEDAFYVSREAARQAVRLNRQFNVIDFATGWKADLIVRKEREFSRLEFDRRQRAKIFGCATWVASAEDVILAKLEWAKRSGGSARQVEDVAGILKKQGDDLDCTYIERWVKKLRLESEWSEARATGSE